MNKIKYSNIEKDKSIYLYMFDLIEPVYKTHKKHKQVLEVRQWRTMLNEAKIEFIADELIVLKNILNDCANWLFIEGNYGMCEIAIKLMNNLYKI